MCLSIARTGTRTRTRTSNKLALTRRKGPVLDLHEGTRRQIPELVWPVAHANELLYMQMHVLHDAADFAILSFRECHR